MAQKAMAIINSHYLRQQEQLQFMENFEAKSKLELDLRMKQDTDIPTMILYDKFFSGIQSQEKRQKKMITQIVRQLEAKRADLADAMAKRRIMEILKERDLLALNTAQKKQDAAQMDEIGANQWRRKFL